jgi:nitrite reductase (NADH) small subunit
VSLVLVDVCGLEELDDSNPRVFFAGTKEIVVMCWRGEVFALRNVCPHQSQSFESGLVRGAIVAADVGDVSVDDREPVLLCPWHTWPYSLRTGRCMVDPKLAVSRYDVTIENGRVLIEG